MENLNDRIAYITINPGGKFVKSAQLGFSSVGLAPSHLIHVSPSNRLKNELKKNGLGVFNRFLLPKLKQHFGNNKSFSNEVVNISIPNIHRVNDLNDIGTLQLIKKLNIKYLVNCGAGIFRKKLIDIPGLTIINAHAGKLPDYKNMNVVEWALFNGDKVIGTIHQIDAGIDTGPVLYEEELDLSSAQNYQDAREIAFDQVIRLAGKTVLAHSKGELTLKVNDKDAGKNWYKMHSYFQKITEGKIKAAQKLKSE